MGFQPNWNEVQPEHKWNILLKQKRFLLWAIYTSVGGMMLGYDFGVAGTATAMPAFQRQMGEVFPSQPSGYLIPARVQSGWFAASAAGDAIGSILAGLLLGRLGRKHVIGIGSVITAVGVAMQVASKNWHLFLAARFINAIGYGSVYIVSPVWMGENSRPELRGFFLCLMNGSIVFGQFLLSCISRGSSTIIGEWSYQTIIVIQFLYIVVLLALYPFFPESPYYLLQKGDTKRARESLVRIHGSDHQVLIDAEVTRIQNNVITSEKVKRAAQNNGPLLLQCFQGSNQKRTTIAILLAAGQQLIGAAFVLGYVTYFLSLIGVTDYFTVSVILYIVMLLSSLSAFILIEFVGRRTLLVYGVFGLTFVLLLMGIMGCINTTGAMWFSVVCIFLWSLIYEATIGAIGFAVASEISTLPLRATVQSIIGTTSITVGWVVGFVTPYMINPDAGDLGPKVGFVFFGLGVPLSIALFFLIPETKGLSFDEIDWLFNNKVNVRHFQRAVRAHREQSEGTVEGREEALKADTTVRAQELPSKEVA